ncbi:MAG: RNA-binding protein [Candidatus Sericytochromatia bacterium]|nr:RNA-binding protein [Candidatus Sericytochromatia bacterium]
MNIYVGNLPDNYTEQLLREKFAQFGKVASIKIITDRETGLSRGFAFIEMKDNYEGQLSIDTLYNWEEDGKRVKVTKAREREERSGGFNPGFNRNSGGGGGGYNRSSGGGGNAGGNTGNRW